MPYSILEQLESATGALTARKLADILGVSEKTVYKTAGKPAPVGIPCFRVGAQIKFDPSAVAYWFRKQCPLAGAARREAVR